MLPSFFAASVALLSLTGLAQAMPQGGFGGPGSGSQSSAVVSSSTVASSTSGSTVAASVSQAAESTSTVACNNSPDLCNRNYNNITHMGAHDAAFLRDSSTSYSTSGNQYYNATKALSAGLRLLQAQVHNSSGTLELCHTTCTLLDAGSLEAWLAEIKTWMDANTNEVVTILLVNSDDEDASSFGSVFEASGISTYGYTPTTTSGPISTWPTLQTLITANTRLVTFIASITYDSTYSYLLPEFTYMFETAYGVTSLSGFNCTLDRPSTVSSASVAVSSGYMGLVNHFADTAEAFGISIPDVTDIKTTNSASTNTTGTLGTQGAQCDSEWGLKPTFMLVDFWNVGPSIETADNLNGITATGRTSVSTDELSSSSSAGMRRDAKGWFNIVAVAMGVVAIGNFVWL
ncbi:uncharacterized protein PAC_19696 [Phialocephala subalpina]|uniref:PLC-like phosphodiesterase n=1 Tax=Phialocephala subalpina TaxID=576137 RepID=A0A1L7XXU2_9HELO|nr:uncharacterized protein PAC_19696 [Phialocephala subalpina]